MRKSVTLTAVTVLLGGCAASLPPPEVAPEPVPVPAEPPQLETRPPQAAAQRATPRRAQAVRIDNTSIDSFRTSWERMRASLSLPQQTNLNNAVVRLTFASYGGVAGMPANLRNSPIVPEMIRDRIAGLTYAEIIALAP